MSNKKTWLKPTVIGLNGNLIETGSTTGIFAEFYTAVAGVAVNAGTNAVLMSANSAAMAAACTGAPGQSYVQIMSACSFTASTPSTYGPGNPNISSSYGTGGCAGGASPFNGAINMGMAPPLIIQSSGSVACS